jgi:hypothetical protein
MRILFIPYILPPLHYPGSLRNLKLLHGLSLCDADIHVCHVDPDCFRHFGSEKLDPELRDKLPVNVTYHSVRSRERKWFFRCINSGPVVSSMFFCWTNPRKKEWTWDAKALLQRLDPGSFDAVVTLSQPHCNHLLGLWVKRKYSVPWISYFSDPWIDNPYANISGGAVVRSYLRRLERAVLSLSDKVLVTSEETRDLFLARYPGMEDTFGVLPHCFVPSWYSRPEKPPRGDVVTLLHCGNFYGPRSPRPLFRALAELEKNVRISRKIRLELVGGIMAEDARALGDLGIDHFVRCRPTVPYLESLALQDEADWLLVVDAPSDGKPSVFLPSKLMDYFGSRKPVLGLTPEEGASARVLRDCGYPVHGLSDLQGLQESIVRISEGWSPEANGIPCRYSADEVGKKFYEYIKGAILSKKL